LFNESRFKSTSNLNHRNPISTNVKVLVEDEEKYINKMVEIAGALCEDTESKNIRKHIEATAGAVWRIYQIELSPMIEPATKLRHGENI
jgi:hypothetical protein